MTSSQKPTSSFLLRVILVIAFASHLMVAAGYWWLSPKGFPVAHCRFWLNVILPLTVMAVAVGGLVGLLRNHQQFAALVALMFASAWLGGAVAGRMLFPQSLRWFWGLGVVIAMCGFGYAWLLMRGQPRETWRPAIGATLSILAGVFCVWAQVPAHSSTRPLDIAAPVLNADSPSNDVPTITLDENIRFDSSSSTLLLTGDKVTIHCVPTLRFDRVSPDGFWSLLAPRSNNKRKLISADTGESGERYLKFSDHTTLKLSPTSNNGLVECTSWASLEQDAHSHLNSFCIVTIEGHQNLSLGFSPCPDTKIEVLPADYPTGRPARFAYLTAQQEFIVVEGNSGEKGPFHTLASGQLARSESLAIALHDNGQLLATLTLDDWTQQLSTELSPSAGWGVPQNAIQFRRFGETESSPVEIFITLASTSIGRGWESVGHRAGTYRNRLSFRMEPH